VEERDEALGFTIEPLTGSAALGPFLRRARDLAAAFALELAKAFDLGTHVACWYSHCRETPARTATDRKLLPRPSASRSRMAVSHGRAGEPPDSGRRPDEDLPGVVGDERPLVDAHSLGEAADRADVRGGVVVGEQRAVPVAPRARAAEVVGGGENRVAGVVDVPAMPYSRHVAGRNCIGPRAPSSLALRTRPNVDSTKLIDARVDQSTPKRWPAA
jgi:hypothetical protein